MDAVRFGRALGFGARQAAKTVISAVDAARAENPSASTPPSRPAPVTSSSSPRTAPAATLNPAPSPEPQRSAVSASATNLSAQSVARNAAKGRVVAGGVKEGITRFRDSTVEPVVRLSGVLWLEVTGVFFGIFALSTAVAIWRLHAQWHEALTHPATHGGLLVAVAVFSLFAYFCVSSFIRARRRERRRG